MGKFSRRLNWISQRGGSCTNKPTVVVVVVVWGPVKGGGLVFHKACLIHFIL